MWAVKRDKALPERTVGADRRRWCGAFDAGAIIGDVCCAAA